MNKHYAVFRLLPVCAALLVAWCGNAEAAVAGRIQFVSGDVRLVDAEGRERPARKGDEISEGDTIVTDKAASAQAVMKDGGFIAVRPDTRLRVETYHYEGKEDGKERGLLSLVKGGFRTITGVIGRANKQNYLIRTPVANIGIRGTDHEPVYFPVATAGAPAGAYDKVNVGEAFIQTDKGVAVIPPNQVGYAASADSAPVTLKEIPQFFKATPAPQARKEEKKEAAKETASTGASKSSSEGKAAKKESTAQAAGGASAGSGESGSTTTASTSVGTQSAAEPMRLSASADASVAATTTTTTSLPPAPAQVANPAPAESTTQLTGQTTTGETLNATNNTVTDAGGSTAPITDTGSGAITKPPGGATGTIPVNGVVSHAPFGLSDFSALPSNVRRDSAGNLTGWTNIAPDVGSSGRVDLVSPTAVVAAQAGAFSTTGIQFGRWTAAAVDRVFSSPVSAAEQRTWAYGPEGFRDPNLPITGTFSYTLDGAAPPVDLGGNAGTLNSLSFSANFTSNTYSASIDASAGGQRWLASAANAPFFGPTFTASAFPGSSANNLSVTKVGCSTCSVGGVLNGAFTGQNYGGALLGYRMFEQGADGFDTAGIEGGAVLARSGTAPTAGTAASTGRIVAAVSGFGVMTLDAANAKFDSAGNLVGWQNTTANANLTGLSQVTTTSFSGTVSGPTNAPSFALTGIRFGQWGDGTLSFGEADSLGSSQFHWITGPAPSPGYLSQVLTGTVTYVLDGATAPTDLAGNVGTLNSAQLSADFSRQAVAVGLSLSVAGHNWSASGAGIPLTEGGRFTSGACSSCLITVTRDNLPQFGSVWGRFSGPALNGAMLGYSFDVFGATAHDQVHGVAAFRSSVANDPNAPYSVVGVAGGQNAPFVTGGYNAASRVAIDGSGALTQFDLADETIGVDRPLQIGIGTATVAETGSDAATGIRWGRWANGSIAETDRITGASNAPTALAGSLHYIVGPPTSQPVALPQTGTIAYTPAGNTSPTDNLGNVGILNSSALTANFDAKTVNARVNATVAGRTFDISAVGMRIGNGAVFAAGRLEPVAVTVNCTGACGSVNQGEMAGAFVGATAQGAGLLYSASTSGAAANATVSGAAAFRR